MTAKPIQAALLILKLYRDIDRAAIEYEPNPMRRVWYKRELKQGYYDSLSCLIRTSCIKSFSLGDYSVVSNKDIVFKIEDL